MYLLRPPSAAAIERFLARSRTLPLSYGPPGLVTHPPTSHFRSLDEQVVVIGHGEADFERARQLLTAWKHFDLGWVTTFPALETVDVGTNVAVLIRHLGFWSLNGARVLYHVGGIGDSPRSAHTSFGFAYGTLTNHAESGEELFEVFVDDRSGDVMYRIRAVSWPQTVLACLGYPIARWLQACFRHESAAAMTRLTSGQE